jgi:hypothetical protein
MKNDTPRHWKPLVKLQPHEMYRRPEIVEETARHYGISLSEAALKLDIEEAKCDYYVNHLYQVQVQPTGPDNMMTAICIRRRDGAADLRDWRHFQQIKNEVCGPEREGFELYPAESRKVDTSNKWHIFVLPEGVIMQGIGWTERDVQYDDSNKGVPGLRQRAL